MRLGALIVLGACVAPQGIGAPPAAWISDTSSYGPAPHASSVADRYRAQATAILAAARPDRGAYAKLAQLTDRVGNRISGSDNLDRAIEWAAQTMKDDGHDVHTELGIDDAPKRVQDRELSGTSLRIKRGGTRRLGGGLTLDD